jgi:hypothetical protein
MAIHEFFSGGTSSKGESSAYEQTTAGVLSVTGGLRDANLHTYVDLHYVQPVTGTKIFLYRFTKPTQIRLDAGPRTLIAEVRAREEVEDAVHVIFEDAT